MGLGRSTSHLHGNLSVDLIRFILYRDALLGLLEQAVTECPHIETFWLMAAKEKWLGGDVEGARKILANAFDRTADSEQIFLAAAKLEIQNNEVTAAKQVMARARAESGSERVRVNPLNGSNCHILTVTSFYGTQIWMKSAVLERDHGSKDEALRLVNEGLTKYPAASKLYMIKGQLLEERDNIPAARETYANGTKKSPQSVPLWIMASRLEEKAKLGIKSRAIMERARMHNPKDSEIWMESIKLEERTGSTGQAKTMMARGASTFFMKRNIATNVFPVFLLLPPSLARVSYIRLAVVRINLDGKPTTAKE